MRKLIPLLLLSVLFWGCKKEEAGPSLVFKSGVTYTDADFVAAPGTTFTVGITASKTNDGLHLFYTESSFDGANTTQLVSRVYLVNEQKNQYSQDITITLRNTQGTERWVFAVNDDDGRITKKEIRVTVQ
jgi:hypothetical protein